MIKGAGLGGQPVAGSTRAIGCNPGQVVQTHVPLLPDGINLVPP